LRTEDEALLRHGFQIDEARRRRPVCVDGRHANRARVLEQLGRDPRLIATAIQTVGSKGYDGFALAVVSSL
jgi:hypothetical protein